MEIDKERDRDIETDRKAEKDMKIKKKSLQKMIKIGNNIGKSREKTQLLQFSSLAKAALLVNLK